jgi:hypothetical protein
MADGIGGKMFFDTCILSNSLEMAVHPSA